MLRAYFDETGIHQGSPLVMITGIVAPESFYEPFENDWSTALIKWGISDFHASRCFRREKQFEPFEEWQRNSMFCDFARVIAKHLPTVVNSTSKTVVWDATSQFIREIFVRPYGMCFEHVVQQLIQWSHEQGSQESIALVFADQVEYQHHADRTYAAYRDNEQYGELLAGLSFYPAARVMSLQAADLLAYEMFRYHAPRAEGREQPIRESMKILLDSDLKLANFPFSPEMAFDSVSSQ